MKRIYIFLLVVISYNSGLIACKIDVDSLLNYHISSIDGYLTGVIDGYLVPNGGDMMIMEDILGRKVKRNYTDSTRFVISEKHIYFLEAVQDLGLYKLERDFYTNSILMSRKDFEIIKNWYINNKNNLNHKKIGGIFLWHKNDYINLEGSSSNRNIYLNYKEKLERLKKLDTFIK